MTDARPAKFGDIPSIISLGRRCLSESRIDAIVNEDAAKALLMTVIGGYREPSKMMDMAAFVTGPEGSVNGLIVGVLQPMYLVLTQAIVTDLMWYVDRDRAGVRAGADLLNALHGWADSSGYNVRRQHVVNDYVMDLGMSDRMMRHAGYRLTGLVYEKEMET